jgi:hypothetical protein
MSESGLRRVLLPAALAATFLAGCAVPNASLVGADRNQVLAQFGAPAERHALPAGAERWLYPLGGAQQFVWAVDVDPSGRVMQVTQVRTGENFGRVRVGADRPEDIRREFGVPRTVVEYKLANEIGWHYPYLEQGIWNSEMVIFFDRQGVVRRTENGPDPRFIGNGNRK